MSSSNVDALRPVYEQWRRGNFRRRFDVYAPRMEWGWSDEFPGLEGIAYEEGDISDRLREWLSPWDEWRVEPEDFVASGEFVVVLCRYSGRGKGSGVEVDVEGAHLWTMRDGRAVRLEIFSSRERALAAAGLGD
jgi:uncharacterized protein